MKLQRAKGSGFVFGPQLAGILLLAVLTRAALAEPLTTQEPFDEITLNKESKDDKNVVFKTFPLDFPGRKVPEEPAPKSELELRLIDRPDQVFRVAWESIKKVRLFEDMVLAEALQAVKEGNFDQAYESLRFLEQKHPQQLGLADAVERLMTAEMSAAYKAGHFDEALAALVEMHRRNPQRKGLAEAWQRVADRLIDAHAAAGNYTAARSVLKGLSQRFPDAAAEMIQKWTTYFDSEGRKFLIEARQHLEAGRFREAYSATARMLDVWPDIAGGQELLNEVSARYPHVSIGVTSAYVASPEQPPDDWAVRRARRLLQPSLLELIAVGAQGGEYRAPLGTWETDEQRHRLMLRLTSAPGAGMPAGSLTAAEAARPFLAAINPGDPAFNWGWTRVLGSVSAPSLFELQLEFHQPQPCPAAWIYALGASVPSGGGEASHALLQPYRFEAPQARVVHFIARPGAVAAASTQPREVIERHYPTTAAACGALRRGEISVIDRVTPWELVNARKLPDVSVERYALPTVHCLAFNPLRTRTADRRFRRALACGINRQAILQRSLLAGRPLDGCQVISGPFPRGTGVKDKHGYAYDEQVEDYPHDPSLAMVLAGVAIQEAVASERARNRQSSGLPTLVLAHPSDEIARLACQSISRQMSLLGIPLDLREVPAGQAAGDNYDLLYVEFAMEEPVVDAARLFCPGGLAGSSAALNRDCERLLESTTWEEGVQRLHELHRAAHREVAVLPLWQLVEHFACHSSVTGIGRRPLGLYQNIGEWRCELARTPSKP